MPDMRTPLQEAFDTWKTTRDTFRKERALAEVLRLLQPAIGSSVAIYRAAPLPQVTLELEAKRMAVEATRGASLATHVGNYVRGKLYRYVSTYQNPARLPEEQVRRIGQFQTAVSSLTEQMGREPTTQELSEHMVLPMAHVARLRTSLRPARLASDIEEEELELTAADPDFERAMLAYYSLTDMEKQVFDYSLGAHGQPRLSPGDIAKRLKVSAPRVSALKGSMAAKLRPYLND
jgi:DNA-directed RNA polymerase sigma subunit (sigma70/sigma32)